MQLTSFGCAELTSTQRAGTALIASSRGDFELLLLGRAAFGVASDDPDGSDNTQSNLLVELSWGLGIDWWITPHWTVGFNALNPLATYTRQNNEEGPDSSMTTSTTFLDITFSPRVSFLLHMYF